MAPVSAVADSTVTEEPLSPKQSKKKEFKTEILWINAMVFLYLHASFFYAIFLALTSANWKTSLFAFIYGNLGQLGMQIGAHRLWSHRSFKAKWPLRLFLCFCTCIAGQDDIYKWCRDHRVHHKFSETNADPVNINRGFFFAHIGWLMCKKHPDVVKKGKTVAVDDLWADPIIRFQKKLYIPMFTFFCFLLPTVIPVWYWEESMWNSFFIAGLAKYVYFLHITWTVNSVSHTYGTQPYEKNIKTFENVWLNIALHGDGCHNFHHAFPWDYSTGESGYPYDLVKIFIDCMAFIGQAYDRKLANPEMVKKRKLKTRDGTRME